MDTNRWFQSRRFTVIIAVFATIAALLFVFAAGVVVGFRKANFSFRWGEQYHRTFGGPRGGLFRDFSGRDFIDAHGVAGQIMQVDAATLVIRGRDDRERVIRLSDDTRVRRFRDTITANDLAMHDRVVIIGSPTADGHIDAQFIRVLPQSPTRTRGR